MVPSAARYQRFRQAVRRFRRQDLMTLTATVASGLHAANEHVLHLNGRPSAITQFSLAAVAREAALCGNEHRSAVATIDDLHRLCDRYMNSLEAPAVNDQHALTTFFVQTAFEQFPWQQSPYGELARADALYVEASGSLGSGVIDDKFWKRVLGCSIPEYFGATFVWFVGATQHGGRIDRRWIDQDNFAPVRATVSKEILEAVLERLTATPSTLRELAASQSDGRYAFNPLQARPVVALEPDVLIAPQPLFIAQRTATTALFYDAVKTAGKAFADELGHVFEHYIGMNLQLLEEVDVHEEIRFLSGLGHERSVDYIVDTGETLILIEVKSTRLSADARVAGPRLIKDLRRGLGKAFDQIQRSSGRIHEEHPAFAHLPRRARTVGLVITLEPYFVAHLPDIREFVGVDPGVPTIVASAAELEHLVAVGQEFSPASLLDALYSTPSNDFGTAAQLGSFLADRPAGRNPLLERSWAKYPWGSRSP